MGKICKKCGKEFGRSKNRAVIDGKVYVIKSRIFCFDCSPFKKHNTKSLDEIDKRGWDRKCKICGKTGSENFYDKPSNICKKCWSKSRIETLRKRKIEWVKKSGGKCYACGFNKYIPSITFHHLDPKTKDGNLVRLFFQSEETIKKEIEKCILLCSNCHTAHHSSIDIGIKNARPIRFK